LDELMLAQECDDLLQAVLNAPAILIRVCHGVAAKVERFVSLSGELRQGKADDAT
jgi:hypothetical protein